MKLEKYIRFISVACFMVICAIFATVAERFKSLVKKRVSVTVTPFDTFTESH